MVVRIAKAADAPKIAHIHVETWRTAYRGQIPDTVLDAPDVERRTALWRERFTHSERFSLCGEKERQYCRGIL